MQSKLFPSETRGKADYGWLKANFSFSFGNWYDPERVQFGVLRVLNDDIIAGGAGFPTHPHDNMEIITIPLKGSLAHKDSMGNGSVIKRYDIQVMSAGTGVQHSEFNASPTEEANTLQIWLFPNRKNVEPRYQQMNFKPADRLNTLQQVLSPNPDDDGVWIHQNAWFHLGHFEKGKMLDYDLHLPANGVYLFVLKGAVRVAGSDLNKRDAIGLWDIDAQIKIEALDNTEFLLMEVPMTN